MNAHVFKFQEQGAPPDTEQSWNVVEGDPQMRTWEHYVSEDGKRYGGVWESSVGTYRVAYADWEFAHIIEGKMILTQDGKAPVTLSAGDAFIVEPGFEGLWKIVEPVRKHYSYVVCDSPRT